MVDLVFVDPVRVGEIWPRVAPLLKSAFDRTGLGAFSDLERCVLSGRSLVWLAWSDRIEAAASTILLRADAGLVCEITACGGANMHHRLPLEEIEAYARREGCVCTRITGRKGWLRVLDGYRQKHIIMDKDLG